MAASCSVSGLAGLAMICSSRAVLSPFLSSASNCNASLWYALLTAVSAATDLAFARASLQTLFCGLPSRDNRLSEALRICGGVVAENLDSSIIFSDSISPWTALTERPSANPERQADCHQSDEVRLLLSDNAIIFFMSAVLCDKPITCAQLLKNRAVTSEGLAVSIRMLFSSNSYSLPFEEARAAI